MLYKIEEMTWKQIQTAAEAGALAVMPMGSLEQHGPHLPVKTDSLLVGRVASAAAERAAGYIGIALFPVLWLGASDHHQRFFALSVDERIYIDMMIDVATSIAKAGFRRLMLLNGHGGNTAALQIVLTALRKRHPDVLAATADYWSLGAEGIREVRTSGPGGAAHGGELETSLMQFLDAASVRTGDIESAMPDVPPEFTIDLVDGGPGSFSAPWEKLSPKGAVGRADLATAEKGERFYDRLVSAVAGALLAFSKLKIENEVDR